MHVIAPEIGDYRHSSRQARLVRQPNIGICFAVKADPLGSHRVAEVLAEQLTQDRGNRWLWLLPSDPNRPIPPKDPGGKHGNPDKDNDDDGKDKDR
ncbi:MAG: hypothetical protein ACRDS0_12585 [Pseudonocardiaceae bacterium]